MFRKRGTIRKPGDIPGGNEDGEDQGGIMAPQNGPQGQNPPSALPPSGSGAAPSRPASLAGGDAGPRPVMASKLAALSFGDDEEEEEGAAAKLRKKKDKKRSLANPDAAAVSAASDKPSEKVQSSMRTGAGEYTSEYLAELKKTTLTLGAPPKAKEDGPMIKLTGLLKRSNVGPEDDSLYLSGLAAPTANLPAAAVNFPPEPEEPTAAEEPPAEKQAAPVAPVEEEEDDDGMIPDAETIKRIKEQRERMRAGGLRGADYVPLSMAGSTEGLGKLDRGGRGIGRPSTRTREADQDGPRSDEEDAEFEDRGTLKFWSAGDAKPGPLSAAHVAPEALEDEEEDAEFIREQIRKGTHGQAGAAGQPGGRGAGSRGGRRGDDLVGATGGMGGRVLESPMDAVVQQAREAEARLRGDVQRFANMTAQAEKQLERARAQRENVIAGQATTKEMMAAVSERYVFLQALRDYIAALCDCLQNKTAIVEELEDHLRQTRERRARSTHEREHVLLGQDIQRGQAALSVALQAMMRGAGPQEAAQDVQAAWDKAEEAALQAHMEAAELKSADSDYFDEPAAMAQFHAAKKDREAARTAALRHAFAALGLKMGPSGKVQLVESSRSDLSPDFEALFADPPDASEGRMVEQGAVQDVREADFYRRERGNVLEAASTVFNDTEEDFASLDRVKRRMEEWKATFPKAYRDVYFPDSAAALFSPYIRTQLLFWEPLFPELEAASGATSGSLTPCHASFDALPWYELLFDYGLALDEKFPEANVKDPGGGEDDDDVNLLPKVVEKVVLPWALHAADKCFDPASPRQAARIVQLLNDLVVYVSPVSSEGMQAILRALTRRIGEEASLLTLPAWPFGAIESVPTLMVAPGLRAFLRAARLLRSACGILRPMLDVAELRAPLLQDLLARKVVPYLRSMLSGQELGLALLPACLELVARALQGLVQPEASLLATYPEEVKVLCDVAVAAAKASTASTAKPGSCLASLESRGRRLCRALLALGDRESAVVVAQDMRVQLTSL